MSLESDGGMILTGENQRTRRKTCPTVTLSTTNPTWIDLVANPGLRGERPATNDLNHGTALYRYNATHCFVTDFTCPHTSQIHGSMHNAYCLLKSTSYFHKKLSVFLLNSHLRVLRNAVLIGLHLKGPTSTFPVSNLV
jgi:hypothetical protein